MDDLFRAIAVGTVSGLVTRVLLLRADYRQYPTYPHAYLSHLSMGVVAAFVGSVALPALREGEFTAVTFLVLVATQFREVRNMEREKLAHLDQMALVPRGPHYVEGIAEVFESRNYLVMLVALVASGVSLWQDWRVGLGAGLVMAVIMRIIKRGRRLGDMVEVELARPRFEEAGLFVGPVFIMNVGLPEAQQEIEKWGVGIVLKGKTSQARDILNNVGQRQAVLHDLTAVLGNRKDVGVPEFTPLARIDHAQGLMGMFLVPQESRPEVVETVLRRVPVLENAGLSAIPEMHEKAGRRKHESR